MLPSQWENVCLCSTKLIHVCKKLPLGLQTEQILSVNIQWIFFFFFFFNFGHGFWGSFSVFPEAPVSYDKKILK